MSLGRGIMNAIENGTGVARLTSPNRSLTRPKFSRSVAFMNHPIPSTNPQDSEIDIEDGPSLLISSQDEFVLITFSEGDPNDPEFQSGQWVLSEQEANRLAVALYKATFKGVR